MNENCLFCKIVRGEIPCTKVYEDDDVLAFMDIGPIIKGHALVIPKKHYDPITETPKNLLEKLIAVTQRIAGAQMNGLKAQGVNIMQNNGKVAGQVIPHVHFHVIPRFEDDGHSWNWNPGQYDDTDEMEAFAAKIRAHCS
jgi:histidine triad (HIT) family protein